MRKPSGWKAAAATWLCKQDQKAAASWKVASGPSDTQISQMEFISVQLQSFGGNVSNE